MKHLFTIAFLVIITLTFTWAVQELKETAKVNYSDLNHRMERMECEMEKRTDPATVCSFQK